MKKEQLPLITSVFLNLTQKCNLRCKYCFIDKYPQDMDYKVAKDAVDFIIKNAEMQNDIPSINFFGGEPMMRWDDIIVPITNYIRNEYGKSFELSMTTNGVLLNDERIQFIKDNNISVMMSIDGDKKTNDLNRPLVGGGSSFDIIEKHIPKMLEMFPSSTFRMTLDHDNCKELLNNCKFAVDNGYNNIFFIPNVFTKWSDIEKQELKQSLHEVAEWFIEETKKDTNITINQFDNSLRKISQINNAHLNKAFRNATDKPAYGKCGVGANKFASIGFNGDIYSCQEMVGNRNTGDKFIIGNIYNGVNEDKRWSVIDMVKVKDIVCENPALCEKCKLKNVCDGGCSINNYFATSNLNVCPEIICYFYQQCLEEAIYIMNEMAKLGNNNFKNRYFPGRRDNQCLI